MFLQTDSNGHSFLSQIFGSIYIKCNSIIVVLTKVTICSVIRSRKVTTPAVTLLGAVGIAAHKVSWIKPII